MNMTGNTILVTGATSGIGRALAVALHAAGNTVIVAGRRQNLLQQLTDQYPGMVGLQVDMADSASITAFAQQVQQRFPKLNVLINNAGISKREDYTAAQVDTAVAFDIIQTNILSVVQLTAALLPTLQAQPQATFIATTSGLAFVPWPGGPTYSATKAFLHSWLVSLRFQLRSTVVEVLELAPPYVQTELGGPEQATDPRAMPLDQFTTEVMHLLAEGKTENGEILVEHVKHLRRAENNGHYDEVLNRLGSF